jgi:diadenosine tetraphosphate (Ap4A) HIT family hydrolase
VMTFDGLESYEAEEMLELVKGVHRKYQSTLQVTDYILIQKNGVLAGQTVPHVHIHILPRSTSINNVSFVCRFFVFSLIKPLDPEQMADYRQAFKF